MTVLGVGIETAATMDSEPVIMVPGEPQTYTTQQKNQVDRFPISLMQSSSTIQLQTRQVQKETYKTQNTFWPEQIEKFFKCLLCHQIMF